MKEISTIDPKNFRNVTVPLEISQIKEYFENKELFFLIDYKNSKIKGNMFLTYISNLDLPSEIVLGETSKEEKCELLKFYMESRNISISNTLKFASAQVLLEVKGIDTSEVFENPYFSKIDCLDFINENRELVNRWTTFVSSSLLFMLTTVQAIEEKYSFKKEFKELDDPQYIGSNVVHLYSVPSFVELFFSTPASTDIYYFRPQFEEYMFRGKNLFHYFFCPENTLFLIFNDLLTGDKSLSDVNSLLREPT